MESKIILTKQQVLDFLGRHKLMSLATFGGFPWIASVYYTFDNDLNLYFLSDPETLHCKQINLNKRVAVAIADSNQGVTEIKRGLQISGVAEMVSGVDKVRMAISMWKEFLRVSDSELSYENMVKHAIRGRMYKVVPKRIKLFDQELFKVADGKEPVLEF